MSDQTPGATPPAAAPTAAAPPPAAAPAAAAPPPQAAATPPAAAPPAAAPPAPAAPVQQAAPVVPPPATQPGPAGPGGPAYATPPGATPPVGGGFKSGKNKTIGLIVAGVVAVGALGGVVGLVAGGGDEDTPSPSAQPEAGTGVLNPAPVGSADPVTPSEPDPTTEESEAPAPSPEPEPAPEPEPVSSGDAVTLLNGVLVAVPAGWEVQGTSETDVSMGDGNGNFVYAVVGQVKPSADAGSVLNNSLESVLPPDLYTQLEMSEISPVGPFGSVTSIVSMDYRAVWADPQAAIPLYGRVYAAVRQDGMAIIIAAEHSPPEDFEANLDALAEVLNPTINTFGS